MEIKKVVYNNRGGERLCLDGYFYNKQYTSANTISWLCAQRSAFGCNGRVTTNYFYQVLRVSTQHTHFPNTPSTRGGKCFKEKVDQMLSHLIEGAILIGFGVTT
ncbi:hypothetical protein GE061_003397 [Apolygus lucorum]|uniref:FLYWCH-type domain-containing protein n=1 Tax=Apolygus lucorum TaxID=248454 RepID=A0A8S9X600_APOLU|nr:hypothetical protein GE061_003397 [Apolygus lucorum]